MPNQFVAQIIGAGESVEAAAFWNHAIIVGYLDTQLGFMLGAPSVNAARFSGNPNLYYSKYSWSQLGHTLFLDPSPQDRWRNREVTEIFNPCLSSSRILTSYLLYLPFSMQLVGMKAAGT